MLANCQQIIKTTQPPSKQRLQRRALRVRCLRPSTPPPRSEQSFKGSNWQKSEIFAKKADKLLEEFRRKNENVNLGKSKRMDSSTAKS